MSVAIVALPAKGQAMDEIVDSHCTIAWCGELAEQSQVRVVGLVQLGRFLSMAVQPFDAYVVGTDLFGPDGDKPVLLIEALSLRILRSWCEDESRSQFRDFRPHISLTNLISGYPGIVTFDRVAVWVGDMREDSTARRYMWQLGTAAEIPVSV